MKSVLDLKEYANSPSANVSGDVFAYERSICIVVFDAI